MKKSDIYILPQNIKKTKGITLIALIALVITIVVLIVLAAVAINLC